MVTVIEITNCGTGAVYPGDMSPEPGQPATLCPPTVAVHNNSNVTGIASLSFRQPLADNPDNFRLVKTLLENAERDDTFTIRGYGDARDALEYLAVGASAVEVGTATFLRPTAALEVVAGLRAELARRGVRRVRDWTGALCGEPLGEPPWRRPR